VTADAELDRAELLARLVSSVRLPSERERIASELLAAAELHGHPALATSLAIGEWVELTSWPPRVRQVGWFAAFFQDDDPDCGRGPTFRILANDGQVWEGPTVRRIGWRASRPR
jgi:hypothetical protein